jgi:hypothetical protein
MPGDSLHSVVQYLHRIIDVSPGAASDADLLERFATRRDESAFALLVCQRESMSRCVADSLLGKITATTPTPQPEVSP